MRNGPSPSRHRTLLGTAVPSAALAGLFCAAAASAFQTAPGSPGAGQNQVSSPEDTPRQPWSTIYRRGDAIVHRRLVTYTDENAPDRSKIFAEVASRQEEEVRDVNGRGEATVAVTVLSMEFRRDGKAEAVEAARFPTTLRILTKSGLLVKETGGAEDSREPLLAMQTVLDNNPAPPEPVRPGAVWRIELPNRLSPGRRVTLVSRYLGTTSLKGATAIHTLVTVALPPAASGDGKTPMTAESERWLDPTSGRTLRSVTHIQNAEFSGLGDLHRGTVDIVDESDAAKAPRADTPSVK